MRDHTCTLSEISGLVYMSEVAVRRGLSRLAGCGVSDENGIYRYAPQTKDLDQRVSTMVELYLERRLAMMQLIYSRNSSVIGMLLPEELRE
jgi:hypothetical protein